MYSPGVIVAAVPTTVTRSRCPRTLTRKTQKPVSSLWNVTRSTAPVRCSMGLVSGEVGAKAVIDDSRAYGEDSLRTQANTYIIQPCSFLGGRVREELTTHLSSTQEPWKINAVERLQTERDGPCCTSTPHPLCMETV